MKIKALLLFTLYAPTVLAQTKYSCKGWVENIIYLPSSLIAQLIFNDKGVKTTQRLSICSFNETRKIEVDGSQVAISPQNCYQYMAILQGQKTVGKQVELYFDGKTLRDFADTHGVSGHISKCYFSREADWKHLTPYGIGIPSTRTYTPPYPR